MRPSHRAVVRPGMPLLVVTGALIAGGPAGCGTAECASFEIISPEITMTDAATGAAICDATIVVLGQPSDGGCSSGCSYRCDAIEGSDVGTVFSLQVSRTGYQTMTVPGVHGARFSCNAKGAPPDVQHVGVPLQGG